MQLSDVFLQLGEERLRQLVRNISIGKLRTYQLYERFKTRTHLPKVNTENLRSAVPRFWKRLEAHEVEFATDLSQAILIAHLDMIATVLNFLGIPNQEGFFEKDIDAKPFLTEGWQMRVFDHFKADYNESLLLFYINHLDWELGGAQQAFIPASVTPAA
ncbi:MAG: hypothetical protein QOJ99_5204 [Bryobacterales bacterium]|jgi:hypothetical protein|nr:hypothetical protein [Bryobacterales bacterium]